MNEGEIGRLLEGRRYWVKENDNKGFIEYRLALTEIGRIEKPAGASKQY